MSVSTYPKYDRMSTTSAAHLPIIPDHWEARRVKYAATMKSKKVGSVGSILPYIGMENVESWSGQILAGGSEVEGVATTFDAGDILFGKLRPYLAKVTKPEFAGICSSEFLVFAPIEEALGDFLAYAMRSSDFINFVNGSTYGAKMPRANPSFVANAELPFPPLPEQRAIAGFLDEKCAKIDKAMRIKEEQIKLLAERRQILIQQAVTRGLNPDAPLKDSGIDWIGQIPAHWEATPLKRLFHERNERTESGKETLLSLRMIEGLVPHDEVSEKPISDAELVGYKKVYPGQLVMNRMRASIGLFGIVDQPGLVSPDYAIFDMRDDLFGPYYLSLFKTKEMGARFRVSSRGLGTGSSGFMRLYTDDFGAISVPTPPREEQECIVNYIDGVTQKINDTLEIKKAQIDTLKEYKTSLINATVTGKIKVS
ncbi:restriction endonuclease subunit S [Celeribacter halophilus]|uniref:restriction endonuclease subunit S n=1 Tax=Celeribacter halophilus TaxID=576117 RepID=UPI001C0833DD|nr:restriction endonuclease subunit S [Celeribacter halophilus]MBU2889924.1 restriction endonuclease subunit S [Celeribacter halophilus]MDO6509262.1 restriction endonuclease subunit S [Celeribacter halophilus]